MGPLWSLLFILLAAGAGAQLLRWGGIRLERPLERLTFGGAVGLGVSAYAVLAIGLAGGLTRPVIWGLAGAVTLLGAVQVGGLLRDGGAAAVRWATAPRGRGEWWAVALAGACVCFGVLTLIPALAPPNDQDWDSLAYHLAAPKLYLQHGRIYFIDYDSHTNFPFTIEMLFTLGLAWGGAEAAKVFHWACGCLTAAAVGAWVQRHLQPSEDDPGPDPAWAGPLAAAFWLSIPLVIWEAGTGYIDLGTAFFQFVAIAALTRALEPPGAVSARVPPPLQGGEFPSNADPGAKCPWLPSGAPSGRKARAGNRRSGRGGAASDQPSGQGAAPDHQPSTGVPRSATGPRTWGNHQPSTPPTHHSPLTTHFDLTWIAFAGITTGWALGTKATALMQAGLLGLLLLGLALRTRDRAAWGATLLFGGLVLLVGSPWYVKSYLWTNNPVYPFFYSLFPNSINWTKEFETAYRAEQKGFGRGYGLLPLLRAPWDLAFNGRYYFLAVAEHRRLLHDRWTGLGPLAIGYGPLLLYCRPDRKVWLLVLYAVASGLVWWFLSQQTRYLMPVFAPLCAAAVGVVMALQGRLLRGAALGLAGVTVAVGLLYAAEMASPKWEVVSGQMTRDRYLQQWLPDLHPAARFVNRLPPASRLALYQEVRGFYFDRDYMWANPMQHDLIPYESLPDGGALVDHLKQKQRITHVLINMTLAPKTDLNSPRWWQLLVDAVGRGRLVPVFESKQDGLRAGWGIVVFEAR